MPHGPWRLSWRGALDATVTLAVVSTLCGGALTTLVASSALQETIAVAGWYSTSRVQTVVGSGNWDPMCHDPVSVNCVVPAGVVFVPPADTLVVTTDLPGGVWNRTGYSNGFEEINPRTFAVSPVTPMGCEPGVPFYPGSGIRVFIPCYPDSLVVVDAETDTVVANVTTPFDPWVMTYDANRSEIFAGDWGTGIIGVDTSTLEITSKLDLTGGLFRLFGNWAPGLAYDARTDQLIAPSSQFSAILVAVSPSGGSTVSVARLAYEPTALGVDPFSPLILVAFNDPSSLLVLDSANYRELTNISLPECGPNDCGEDQVTDFAFDQANGDVYLSTGVYLDVLNVSSLTIVGTINIAGDGWTGSLTYVPGTDTAWGTYQDTVIPAPGYLAVLSHSNSTFLTGLLWVPPALAPLVIGAVAGAGLATVQAVHRSRTR